MVPPKPSPTVDAVLRDRIGVLARVLDACPALSAPFFDIMRTLETDTELPATDRILGVLHVAQRFGDPDLLAAYSKAGRECGLADAQLAHVGDCQSSHYSARQTAVLRFARAFCTDPHVETPSGRCGLEDHLSQRECLELGQALRIHIGLAFFNSMFRD